MKIAKIWRKRRAVSPVIAAILLIGLAVAAGAALFLIVLPMIQSSGELSFGSVKFSDTNNTDVNDKVVFTLTNEQSKVVSITAITVQAYDGTNWDPVNDSSTTTTFPFNIGVSQSEIDITYTFTDPSASYSKLRIRVAYKIGDEAQDDLVSAEYDV